MKFINTIILALLLAAAGTTTLNAQKSAIDVPLPFDRYYDLEDVYKAIEVLNEAFPELTSAEVIAQSEEGRDVWAFTINNPETGDHLSKPGVYVDGNIHGNEIQATEVVLYLMNYLLTNYGEVENITELVDRNAFYFVPSVNVDGRYHFFNNANTPSTNRGLRVPGDGIRDAVSDRSISNDLNNDGSITQMRKRDPFGQWKTHPEDPRLMVRAEPGEFGEWTLLGQERYDITEDTQISEDAERYVDPNRDWGSNWAPPYVQRGAGDYPFMGNVTKAIAEYMVDRPNIIMVFAFHNTGGMFLRGPGTKARGPLNPNDVAVYDILGQNAEKIVPGYDYLISWKDLYSTYGDFTEFTYNTIGAFSFVGELFMARQETYAAYEDLMSEDQESLGFGTTTEQDLQRLKFNDNVAHGTLFKEWEPFEHPIYGEIEIGGWAKMSTRISHPFMLKDMAHRNAAAVLFAAAQTPDVEMEIIRNERIDDNLNRVRVRLVNHNAIPTMTNHAVQNQLYPKDMLTANGDNIRVVAGGKVTDRFRDRVDYKEHRPELQFLRIAGTSVEYYDFLVEGNGELTIEYNSRKAGSRSETVGIR